MGSPLNERQRAVLEWIAAGCRVGEEPVERYKQSAVALANRRLIVLDNSWGTPWRAQLTPLGRYWLDHGTYPPVGTVLGPPIEQDIDDTDAGLQGEGISDADFINRRRMLAFDWSTGGRVLSCLELDDQWALHAAYQPSKDLSDAQALADYRGLVEGHDRVAQAPEAWEAYEGAQERVQQELARAQQQKEAGVVPRRRRQQDRNLSVRGLARPEPDIEKLAHVLINIALTEAKVDKASTGAEEGRDPERTATDWLAGLAYRPLPSVSRPSSGRKASRRQRADATSQRMIPVAVDIKLKEAWSCHRAGTHLAAVLVARTALSDALADAGTARLDSLIESLDELAQQGHLSSDLARRAAATRSLAVVPSHPPVTADEAEALLNLVVEIITRIYLGGPMT